MTKERIIELLNKKIKEAKELSNKNHGINTDTWSNYYCGRAKGFEEAKSLIGMLNTKNK